MTAEPNRFSSLAWRKSTHSTPEQCVEVAPFGGAVAVRDSHDPHGPVLVFDRTEWRAFTLKIGGGALVPERTP